MSDHDPDNFGERLRDLVPDPPAAPGRASAAVGLARRRRRVRTTAAVVGAAASVAVVVGAVALVPGDQVAEPAGKTPTSPTSPTRPAQRATDVACPEPQRRGDPVEDPTESSPLPGGAVVVRMCSLSVPSYGGFRAPLDALTGQAVADFVDLVESQTVDDRDEVTCTADGGISYGFALGYPDGSRRVLTAGVFGCDWVDGAGPLRFGAEQVVDAYLDGLRAQRDASGSPEVPAPDLACPGSAPWPDTPGYELAETTSAILCVRETNREREVPWRGAVMVPAGDLSVLVDDLSTEGPMTQVEDCAGPQLALVGSTQWGDVGTTHSDCGAWFVGPAARSLRPEAQAVVDRLLTQVPPAPMVTPTVAATPDEVVNSVVDLVDDGHLDVAAKFTRAPELLDAGGRVDVKTGAWRPVPTPRSVSAPTRLAEVELIYRVGDGEYRDAVARLSRLPGQPWFVGSVELGEVAPTGD